MAPDAPYPLYEIGWTHLLLEDPVRGEEYLRMVDRLVPEGFMWTPTLLDCLSRIQSGQLPPGAYIPLLHLHNIRDQDARAKIASIIVAELPHFAALWCHLAAAASLEDAVSRALC
jgi:hypothetical protein